MNHHISLFICSKPKKQINGLSAHGKILIVKGKIVSKQWVENFQLLLMKKGKNLSNLKGNIIQNSSNHWNKKVQHKLWITNRWIILAVLYNNNQNNHLLCNGVYLKILYSYIQLLSKLPRFTMREYKMLDKSEERKNRTF